jgi:hypothetical protein
MELAVRERDVERYFKRKVEEVGGEVRKVKWIGRRGAPDRVVFLNGTYWVELKAPGEKPRPEQTREHSRMWAQGAWVYVLDSFESVDNFIGAFA